MSRLHERVIQKIGKLDQMIHIPARLMIIKALNELDRLDCVELAKLTDLSWGNLSSHLSRLEESGYIRQEKSWIGKKPNTRVEITDQGRKAFLAWAGDILAALPSQINKDLILDREPDQTQEELPLLLPKNPAEQGAAKVLWFLPTYHKWDISVPPIDSLNQQCN